MVLSFPIYHLDPLLITSLPTQILRHTNDAFGLITTSMKNEFGKNFVLRSLNTRDEGS